MTFTTIEKLALDISPSYDALVRYGGKVCVAKLHYKGTYKAEIYEFIDEPDEEISEIECRLSLSEKATETFKTSGEAIMWCFKKIG